MASYSVKNIFLVQSDFKRTHNPQKLFNWDNSVDIQVEPIQIDQRQFNIALHINFKSIPKGATEADIEFYVKMVGLFEKEEGDSQIPDDFFINVNAPAIIFPFVREHISTLTAKAGLDAVLLPPFNFVAQYENKKQD